MTGAGARSSLAGRSHQAGLWIGFRSGRAMSGHPVRIDLRVEYMDRQRAGRHRGERMLDPRLEAQVIWRGHSAVAPLGLAGHLQGALDQDGVMALLGLVGVALDARADVREMPDQKVPAPAIEDGVADRFLGFPFTWNVRGRATPPVQHQMLIE